MKRGKGHRDNGLTVVDADELLAFSRRVQGCEG